MRVLEQEQGLNDAESSVDVQLVVRAGKDNRVGFATGNAFSPPLFP
jgi:hypothetical protein